MGRLDWESGRFGANYEMAELSRSLRGWQANFGDHVLWYRFWGDQSEVHDIWDEATGVGRVWHPPQTVQVLHATHSEGGSENRAQGQYYNDDFYATASMSQLKRMGFSELDMVYQNYLNDRIVYDFRVFKVTKISITGQIQQTDPIVSIEATQVKPDEMLNDEQFAKFANAIFPENP